MRWLLPLLSLLALRAVATPVPAPSTRLREERWPAAWITQPEAGQRDFGVYLFRKPLLLAQRPAHFVVHVTGDARYRFFVNGQSVAFGPQRSDRRHWAYDTVDLAPWLQAGANVLAAEVWNYGAEAPAAIMSWRTGFILQGDTPAEEGADTNASWKVWHDEAWQPRPLDRARIKEYIVTGPGFAVDAARHPWGWQTAAFDDRGWPAARVIERGEPHGWGTNAGWWLQPRSIPAMAETPLRLGMVRRASGVELAAGFAEGKAPLTVPAHTRASVLLDQGFETNAFPKLTVSGGRGSRVTLTYAEALVDAHGRKGNRDEVDGRTIVGVSDAFRPDGGAHRLFAPLDFRTYRYLQLDVETGAEPLVVDDLHGVATGYPFVERGSFASDDPALQRIWDTGWRTARLCAGETYMDCPYYEQLQYVGDTRIQGLISLAVSGDGRLMRNAIVQLDDSRIPEGLTQSRYPASVPQVISPFSLFWVDLVHDYWMHRDEPAFVQARLPGVAAVLAWFERHLDARTGLLGPLPYWTFVDWTKAWPWNDAAGEGGVPPGAHTGGSSIVSLQLAGTLQRAADLFRACGRPVEADHYAALAAGINAAAVRTCWDQTRRMFADSPAKLSFSQHANIMAVLSGAIGGDAARELIGRVADDRSLVQCSLYYRFYLLRAMKRAGLGDEYVARLGPWRDMLAEGLSTFAEVPGQTRSDCHAWSASPVYELLATVAGIEPGSPGFATVRIEPHLGALRRVAATMPHPKGDIRVRLQRNQDWLVAQVTLPPGLTGTFVWEGRRTALVSGEQTLQLPLRPQARAEPIVPQTAGENPPIGARE